MQTSDFFRSRVDAMINLNDPRNGSWMRASVPRAAGLARRDEAAHSGAQ